MLFTLKATRVGLRNSTTRIPFRYGSACLRRCPQAVLEATLEIEGRRVAGFSGDCLPPSWFDKTAGKPYAEQIADLLAAIARAEAIFAEEAARPTEFFPAWLASYHRMQEEAPARGWNPLVASFGLSMVERAVMDALCRAAGLSLAEAVRGNLFAIEPGLVHPALRGLAPCDWLPPEPRRWLYVRHTVGLGDPLTAAEIREEDAVYDGFPHALEDYIAQRGICYLKVKISNNLERDWNRLVAIAQICERHLGGNYRLTLDGNEQYKRAEEFLEFIETIRGTPRLATLLANVIAIEQPLSRDVALDPRHTQGIRDLAAWKPVIIDESDGTLWSYAEALELGYRGVSSKNCKGPLRSLLNFGLTWLRNDRGADDRYLMTGEDLCTVGVVPVQSDIALVATLGLTHIERNGHHYHPGLSYLPAAECDAALAAHGDFYERVHGRVAPRLERGGFAIDSLHCAGYGFAVTPKLDEWATPAQWSFASLDRES